MGGREYLAIAGAAGKGVVPDVAALQRVIDCGRTGVTEFCAGGWGRLRAHREVDQCRDAQAAETRRTGDGVCLFDERLGAEQLGLSRGHHR